MEKAGEIPMTPEVTTETESYERLADRLVAWLRRQAEQAQSRGAVFGLSGGIDSAVVGALCRRAFGSACLGLIMPCHSHPADADDARLVADEFQIPYRVVDLTPVFDHLCTVLQGDAVIAAAPGDEALALANLKPRLRMTTLYYYANRLNYLVVGTGNRSELEVGYFTKYGDGGVDLLPLGALLKKHVRGLARALGVPQRILDRTPSAGLWEGQSDEGELGLTYAVLDRYLEEGVAPEAAARRIEQLRTQSAHKRRLPPIGPGPGQASAAS